jgi:hypothetical protein
MMIQKTDNPIETLHEIRHLMERSSRFISLSGLSGIGAGIIALLSAGAAYWYMDVLPFTQYPTASSVDVYTDRIIAADYLFFFGLATITLGLAVGMGIFFTTRKAQRQGLPIWDALTRRLLINLMIPLFVGGIFCLALLKYKLVVLIAPATLIFYGLALVNASKYTLKDVRYLGLSELALGVLGLFLPGYGLEFWAIGFGVLHIVYGTIMYYRYERT